MDSSNSFVKQNNGYNSIIEKKTQERRQEAIRLQKQGLLEESIVQFTKVIFLNPQSAEGFKELGDAYREIKDYTSAINMYKKSNSLQKHVMTENALKELIVDKGMMLLEQGEYQDFLQGTQFEAFSIFLQFNLQGLIIKDKSKISPGQQNFIKAVCYMQLSFTQYALEELNQALKLDEKFVEALLLKGKILWKLNNIPEGNQQYWKVENLQPNHPEVEEFMKLIIPQADELLKQIRYLVVQNKLEDCLLKIKKGLDLFPNNTQFLLIKGFILRKQGEYEQALSHLLQASHTLRDKQQMEIEVRSQISLTFNEIGVILYGREQFLEAIDFFNQSILYKPQDWSCYINLGDCYRMLNNLVKALDNYELARKYGGLDKPQINNRLSIVRHSMAIIQFNEQQYKDALDNFNQAILLTTNQASFYENRGKCLLQMKRQEEAIEDFLKSYELNPKNHEISTIINNLKQQNTKIYKKQVITINNDN